MGELCYYLGTAVDGTGQCEDKDGEITVDIQPYEEHNAEKEILKLKYANDDGEEYIFMNWYDEDVYWKRESDSSDEETGLVKLLALNVADEENNGVV